MRFGLEGKVYRIRTLSRLIGERPDLLPHEAEPGTDFRKLLEQIALFRGRDACVSDYKNRLPRARTRRGFS